MLKYPKGTPIGRMRSLRGSLDDKINLVLPNYYITSYKSRIKLIIVIIILLLYYYPHYLFTYWYYFNIDIDSQ